LFIGGGERGDQMEGRGGQEMCDRAAFPVLGGGGGGGGGGGRREGRGEGNPAEGGGKGRDTPGAESWEG